MNDIKHSKQKVKEWLKTVLQSVLSKSAMMTSPPKPLIEILARGKIPRNWKKFLPNAKKKKRLTKFLLEE